MLLSTLAALGSFISGVAVLVSLVFLYFQVKQVNRQVMQAERNQQAAIRQARATRTVDLILSTKDEALADAYLRAVVGDTSISPTQFNQFRQILRATFVNCEDTFYQHEEGVLNDAAFASFVTGMKGTLQWAGFRAQWKTVRSNYGAEFVEFMDKIVAEIPVSKTPEDAFAIWKNDVAAELKQAIAGSATKA
jgi:hypothetical protein